jgi:acetyltransferase-like isoleucine patch superfamily enzyme
LAARRVRLTRETLDWLASRRVFFAERPETQRLRPGDILTIPTDVRIEPYVGFLAGKSLFGLGAFSYSYSVLPPRLETGRYCSIAAGVTVPRPRHPVDAATTSPCLYDDRFQLTAARLADAGAPGGLAAGLDTTQPPLPRIGHDVWIGLGAVLLPGVTIATGAVVAAHAVVTRDVPPYALVAGNPARHVRDRLPGEVAERLLASAWWRFAPEQLKGLDLAAPARFAEQLAQRLPTLEPFDPDPLDSAAVPGDVA